MPRTLWAWRRYGSFPKYGVTEMVRRLNFPREVEDLVGRYF